MNVITFTPINSVNTNNNVRRVNTASYQPSFKGGEKLAKKQTFNPLVSVARQLYSLFFVPEKCGVTKFEDGFVYTKRSMNKGKQVVSKKYPMWGKEPVQIVEDDYAKCMRKKITHNPDKTNDIEYRDMYSPEHKISVKYNKVEDGKDFKGGMEIEYCGKSASISPEERKNLIDSFSEKIDKTVGAPIKNWSNLTHEEFQTIYNNYFHSSDVIGAAILSSPNSLERQLQKVPSSMPYGIEAILEKLGK